MQLPDFKQPDLNAPRYRPITFNPLTREFLAALRKEYPQLKSYSDKLIRNVIKNSNQLIASKIVECRDGIELPESLGNSIIGTCKRKIHDNPNFKVSEELAKKVQHRNWKSDNYLAKILYTNHSCKYKFKFHELWTFKPCRTLKRTVAKTYPDNWKKYIYLEPTMHITKLYKVREHNNKVEKFLNKKLESYDEFEEF